GTTADRLLAHLERLLASAVASPESRLSELPLLTPAEHSQAVLEWNDTAADFPEDRCLHELLAAQARRTPAALALAGGEVGAERLTFVELDAVAERLAARLRALGVGAEAVVAL